MNGGPAFPHLPAESWQRFLSDDLDGAARARLETHVDDCAACRGILLAADPSRSFRALRGSAPEADWTGFWDEIQPRLGPSVAARARRRARMATALGAAACLALVALVAWHSNSSDVEAERACSASTVAGLRLTRDECEALHSGPIEATETELVVVRTLDLRGL